jgi:uncharacterized membrane protein
MQGKSCAAVPVIISLLATTLATPATAEVRYQVTPLGAITPTGVNEQGQVVGSTGAEPAERRGALWLAAPAYGLAAGLNDLGRPGFGAGADGLSVSDINDLGQIVGTVSRTDASGGVTGLTAALWLPSAAYGHTAGWSRLDETLNFSSANSINNSGQVAGLSGNGAMLWLPAPAYGKPAGRQDLAGFVASDVNEAGQATGFAIVPAGSNPFVHFPVAAFGQEAGDHVISFGPFGRGPFSSSGNAINERGQVAGGWSQTDFRTGRATSGGFLWLPEDDPVHGLPAGYLGIATGGLDLNDAGLVLGSDSAGAALGTPRPAA